MINNTDGKFFFREFIILIVYFLIYLLPKKNKPAIFKKINFNLISADNSGSGLVAIKNRIFDSLPKKNKIKKINLLKFFKKSLISKSKPINLFVGNPDLLILAIRKLNFLYLYKNYNIALWFWELELLPTRWIISLKLIDEVWVHSDFVLNIFKKHYSQVFKIPFVINFKLNKKFDRAYFKLPKNKFIFLFNFDCSSFYHRKNPEAVIKAFKKAFGDSDNVFLLIKSTRLTSNAELNDKLILLIGDSSNIKSRDILLSDEEQHGLLNAADCYISLHRSEGLGLGMAEAMYLGKPVIATNYSGNLEFMNSENSLLVNYKKIPVLKNQYIYSKNQSWADPSIKHAAELMLLIFKNKPLRLKIGREAARHIKKNFNIKQQEIAIKQRLLEI